MSLFDVIIMLYAHVDILSPSSDAQSPLVTVSALC